MRALLKTAFALSLVVLALFGSLIAAARQSNQVEYWHVESGLTLGYRDGDVIIASEQGGMAAESMGVPVDGVVTFVNNINLQGLSPSDRLELVQNPPTPIDSITIAVPSASRSVDPNTGLPVVDQTPQMLYYTFSDWYSRGPMDLTPLLFGFVILVGGWFLIGSGRAGKALRPFALTLPVASAMPLLLVPLDSWPSEYPKLVSTALLLAGTLPLGLDFAAAIPGRARRIAVGLGVLAVLAGALAFEAVLLIAARYGYGLPYTDGYTLYMSFVPAPVWDRFGLVVLMTVIPGILVASPLGIGRGQDVEGTDRDDSEGDGPRSVGRRFVASPDVALAAITPAVSGISLLGSDHQTWPIVLWLVGLFVASRFGIAPLQRLVQRTSRQRDLVVAATERERARIAGDIHDYALQDLTMLVRRLDAAGDTENAGAARDVAERLRAICGDLRLPILDDLGVGPALDWLVDRLEPDTGKLDLELFDREQRLTPEAELGFFRVAQEAIANAIHHAATPITVRYWGGGDWAELMVDDCGAGIPAGAAEAAERAGHMGLMSMSQRAEAIGAALTFERRPGGGTRVHMTWERKGEAAASGGGASGGAASGAPVGPAARTGEPRTAGERTMEGPASEPSAEPA